MLNLSIPVLATLTFVVVALLVWGGFALAARRRKPTSRAYPSSRKRQGSFGRVAEREATRPPHAGARRVPLPFGQAKGNLDPSAVGSGPLGKGDWNGPVSFSPLAGWPYENPTNSFNQGGNPIPFFNSSLSGPDLELCGCGRPGAL